VTRQLARLLERKRALRAEIDEIDARIVEMAAKPAHLWRPVEPDGKASDQARRTVRRQLRKAGVVA